MSPRSSLNSWKLFSFCFFEGLGSKQVPIYQDQKEILSLIWTEIFLWWNYSSLFSYVCACELDYSWALCTSIAIPTPHSDGGLSIWSLWLEDVDQQCGGYLPEMYLMSLFYAVLILINPIVGSHCLRDRVNRFHELNWDTICFYFLFYQDCQMQEVHVRRKSRTLEARDSRLLGLAGH